MVEKLYEIEELEKQEKLDEIEELDEIEGENIYSYFIRLIDPLY